jgi:riboflavin transporter FmnP
MLVPAIIPFNVIKAAINSTAAFILFRVVEKVALK